MSRTVALTIAGILCLLLNPTSTHAQLNQLETPNMRLVYLGELQSYVVPHVTRCFENSLEYHQRFFDYSSSEKITVFLHDFMDFGNAGASTAPRNRLAVAVAPISYAFETTPANERMNSTLHHELVHIVCSDKAVGSDRVFRTMFFGKVKETQDHPITILYSYLTTPRRSAPRWYHEGIAVFLETWMTGGLGRALGPWDEMVFRTKVLEDRHMYDWVGLTSEGTKIDFQVGVNAYLYGGRFMSYLALEYGPEKVVEWVDRDPGSKAYFAAQFKKVFGLSMDDSWDNWLEWERQFQRENLEHVREYPITDYRVVSQKPLGSVSRTYVDTTTGDLIAAVNFPGRLPHIAAVNLQTGAHQHLCDVKDAALYHVCGLTFDQQRRRVYYTTDNNNWRDLVSYDLATGEQEVLMKDCRVGDLCFNPADNSIWGVRHDNGISTIVRIPYPYEEWNQVYSWKYGRDVYDLDISADGSRLSASLAEISGRQKLILFDVDSLIAGDTTYRQLYDFGNSTPAGFTFSAEGNYLYGSSYYTGVSNLFRYDLVRDSMEALTNVESGMFRPVPLTGDSLLAFRYTDQGFLPVMIEERAIEDINPIRYLGQEIVEDHPVVKDWIAESPERIDIDSVTVGQSEYHGLPKIGIVSAYPIVEGYKDFAAVGMRFELAEPLSLHHGDISVSYTPDQALAEEERVHVGINYGYMDWQFHAQYNGADFYDLFGPTKTSRKGYSAGIRYKKTLLYDSPRQLGFNIGLTGYADLERLPSYQNITTSFENFLIANASLGYRNLRASLGAVDYEKGIAWSLRSDVRYGDDKVFPRFWATLDNGLPLPIGHTSIWLRTAAGYSPGDRLEPFANFFFGGFGNNWVDHGSVKRYRAYYSFPGLELNEIGGTNFGRAMLELTLPPLRFRRLGIPSFFASWARMALFSTAVVTNMDEKAFRTTVYNAGAQVDIRLMALSHLNFTFSAGYARAFEKSYRPVDEWMFSFKIL